MNTTASGRRTFVAKALSAAGAVIAAPLLTLRRAEAAVAQPQVPIGSIVAFAGPVASIPEGWLVCDGSPLNRTISNNQSLFNAIGTTWGGDGAPTFYLPDFRGMFLRGVNLDKTGQVASERDPDSSVRMSPRSGPNPGNNGNNVGSIQNWSTRAPNIAFSVGGGEHSHGGLVGTSNGSHDDGSKNACPDGHSGILSTGSAHSHSITGGDNETRPVNAYVYYIIRAV